MSPRSQTGTYVLVHGAWHGSWCWKRVRRALRAAGHDVFTPTLTGVGERCHLNSPDVQLSTHVADVVNLIRWEELSDVILCGHSYGGAVISGVADGIPERIRALVYLDAFVLEDGECVLDLVSEEQARGVRQQARDTGDGFKVSPIPAEVFNTNSRDRAWVDAQCTPHPLPSLEERIRLAGGLGQVQDVTHILAADYRGTPFVPSHERARKRGWKTREIACGHEVMLDLPDALSEMLLEYV